MQRSRILKYKITITQPEPENQFWYDFPLYCCDLLNQLSQDALQVTLRNNSAASDVMLGLFYAALHSLKRGTVRILNLSSISMLFYLHICKFSLLKFQISEIFIYLFKRISLL